MSPAASDTQALPPALELCVAMRQQAGIVQIDAESNHVDFTFAPLAAELHARYETDRVGGAPVDGSCASTSTCATMIGRNTYVGDPLYSWDFHLARYFQLTEHVKLDVSVDAFNFLNRSNVDEVTSVYGSPVLCGSPAACPVGDGFAIPGVGSFASTPITTSTLAGGSCSGAGMSLNPLANISATCLFIPATPSPTFGLPRTMLNPRQFQLAAKFSF